MAPATTGDAANTGEADLLHGPVGAAAGGDAGGAAEAVDDPAPPGGGGSGKPKWGAALLEAIIKADLEDSILTIGPAIERLFAGAGVIGAHHFTSRRISCNGKNLILRHTTGQDRADALMAFGDQVIGSMPSGLSHNREAVISTLSALLSELCDGVSASSPSAAPADPAAGDYHAIAAAFAQESVGAEKRKREMPPEDCQKRLKTWQPKAGPAAPKYGDVPHLQQCKVLTNEVEGGSFPCHPNAQPLKICDAEDVHKHVGKDEDVVAGETKSVLTVRLRVDRWAHGIAVAVANMPDAEEAYGGALAVAKALRAATNITNVEVLKTVMDSAMSDARKAFDGEYGVRRSLGQAFQSAAQTIARQDASLAVQMAAGKGKQKPTKPDTPRTERTSFKIKVDGKKKDFAILAGGNPDCPVDCNRNHAKNAKCAFNHRNIA